MTSIESPRGLDAEITSSEFFSNPYPIYRRLRNHDPVHWCEPWNQWLVTRYEDVMTVLHDPATFSSAGWERRFLTQLDPLTRPTLPYLWRHYETPAINNADAPVHTRLRRMVAKSFTPKVIESLRPTIIALVQSHIRRLQQEDCFDLIAEFAYPIPALVIADLLGVPSEARHKLQDWSEAIVAFVGTGWPVLGRAEFANAALAGLEELVAPLAKDRRERPREDLLSLLVAPLDGDELTYEEVIAACIVLLFAGHETTANLIGNGTRALLAHPQQLKVLRESQELAPRAVEELLRFDSPVQRVRRVVLCDCELGGREIRAGQLVMAFLGSANRDPERFADPDCLDITRQGGAHVAFGHGIHSCVGAALTRLEAPIVFNALLESFPRLDFEPSRPAAYKPNITFRGLESLFLVPEPAGAPPVQSASHEAEWSR